MDYINEEKENYREVVLIAWLGLIRLGFGF